MVPRFNCRFPPDEAMFEEEGGQYVDAEDYDKLCNFLMDCFNKLTLTADGTKELANDMEFVALNGAD